MEAVDPPGRYRLFSYTDTLNDYAVEASRARAFGDQQAFAASRRYPPTKHVDFIQGRACMMIFSTITRTFSFAALTAALLAESACAGGFGQVHERFHQTIASSNAPTVHVDNVAGTIHVATWNKRGIDVTGTKYARDAQGLRGIVIAVHSQGRDIFIATKYTGSTKQGGVSYTISVPANASLAIKNVAGTVNVGNVRGNVDIQTQAGTIDAALGKVDGTRSIDLSATTGTVGLSIARNSSARVTAHSTVGSFSSEFPSVAKSSSDLVGVRANGTIGSGSATIRLSTTMGAIDLKSHA